jgi:hypothetical protein
MFAEKVIASGKFKRVILVPAAVGGTPMESWAPGGIHWDRILVRMDELKASGYKATHFLVSQGEREADMGDDGVKYQKDAIRLLSALKKTGAEVYLATTGRCNKSQNLAIRTAQERARLATRSYKGPDLDLIGPEHRVRGCHLDGAGARQVSASWADAVLNQSS